MRGENNSVRLAQLFDKISYFYDLSGIETYRRLVKNEHGRIADQRLGKADALLVSL